MLDLGSITFYTQPMLIYIGLPIIRTNLGSIGLFQMFIEQCNTITNEVDLCM